MDIRDIRSDLKNSTGGIAGWVRWAVRERRLVYLLVAGMIGLGAAGLVNMNKNEFPTFDIKQGLVAGIYPGATAAEVEQQLTVPLEKTLFSYKEVIRESVHSVSKDGICYIYVDLNVPQSRKDEVWSKIKLGLQARKLTLPSGVLAVAVLDEFSNTSSLLIAVESDDKSYFELQDYTDMICDRLRQIPALASVSVVGAQKEEIAITLDRERLSTYGIDPATLLFDYQTSAVPISAGNFRTLKTDVPIHVGSTVDSEKAVAERIIYSDPSGNVVRLKDIATIQRRYKKPSEFVSYNGHTCLVLNVEMRPDNNVVAFGRAVDEVLDGCMAVLPDSVRLSRISDQPKVVGSSVWSFLRDLLISMLVVIFVMIMMFPLRSALIASSGVPVCTAVAIGIMYMAGIDLNTVTLAALIVCLGMIVDDSIITMDGYMDKLSRGLHGSDAAAASARELFLPTFIATLAICLMFFPMTAIITGYLGDFVRLFPWVILSALMMSMFYAVTVVPSLEVRFIRPESEAHADNVISRAQNRFFSFLQNVYEAALGWCFNRPALSLCFGVGAVVLGVLMFLQLNIQMMPKAARDYFVIEVYLEAGSSIDRTKAVSDSLTTILLSDSRVSSVTAFVGTGAPRFSATYPPILPSAQTAQLIVNTSSSKATEEIIMEYERKYEQHFPEALVRFKQMDYQAVDAPVSIRLRGTDRAALESHADSIRKFMNGIDELKWIHSDADDYGPAVMVSLDPDDAARMGVNKSLLSLSLAGTFNGQSISSFWEDGKEIPVNIYSQGIDDDMGFEAIMNQYVATSVPGVSVPLRQVADMDLDWVHPQLSRDGGQPSISISADLKYGCSQPSAEKKIRRYVNENVKQHLDPGISLEYEGLSSMNKQVIPEIALSFLAACAVLFLFLLFHFKKASIAVLTMVLSSVCLFGASFGLWIFNLDFTITAVLGLISLVGIIVRNGILMFEYAEDARTTGGMDIKTASMEAGKRRMRPIFLTSCTTALGVFPMIISGDLLWMPMGVVICFGTLLSIIVLVLIMPISYWQLFKNADNPSIESER